MTLDEAFNELKSRLELSQTLEESVKTHHKAIREWIESLGTKIETKIIGSLQRKTRIQPRPDKDTFDIDILVVLGSFYSWLSSGGVMPVDALNEVQDIVSQNRTYLRMGPETDSPAIILEYSDDIKVELIPAYIDRVGYSPSGVPTPPVGRGYWIPKNNKWAIADYDFDADYISKANEDCDDYLIPTIKMLKAIKRNLFPDMKSYHLETSAAIIIPATVKYLTQKGFQISYPLLVFYFFLCTKKEILKSVGIPGSKTTSADEYMTLDRKQELSKLFNDIVVDYVINNEKDAAKWWRELFGPPFPSES